MSDEKEEEKQSGSKLHFGVLDKGASAQEMLEGIQEMVKQAKNEAARKRDEEGETRKEE